MSDPRMLGEVASSLWRGRMLVGGLTRLAAAQSALAGMGFDRLAGWQAGRSLCRAVWSPDESIDGHGDQLAIQSSCMLQNATVERMLQISQMSDLKQSLSLCARARVAIIGKCRCWKYIARPSNAHPRRSCCCAVSSSVCGRSSCAGGLAKDESCCPRVSEAACSSSQLLVRSGVGVVVGLDCLLAWHRQHLVAIASCRCSSRGLVANGHRGGVVCMLGRPSGHSQCRVQPNKLCKPPSGCRRLLVWWQAFATPPGVVDSRGMSKWSRFAQVAAVKRSLLEVGHPAVHRKQLRCPKILVFHRDLHTSAAPSEHVGIAQDLRKSQVTCLSRDLSCRMDQTPGGWCSGASSGLGGGDPSPNLHNDSPRTPVTIPR
jgi:hypothetical protein